ncbi:MAG: hypothetical protein QM765_32830 [Myxococcales bacterium]
MRGIVTSPVLRGLRVLRDVPGAVLEGVVTVKEPWARLEVLHAANYEPKFERDPPRYPKAIWEPLLAGTALPALRELELSPPMHDSGFTACSDLWASPLAKRLQKITARWLRPWDVAHWYTDLREKARGQTYVVDLGRFVFKPVNGELSELAVGAVGGAYQNL